MYTKTEFINGQEVDIKCHETQALSPTEKKQRRLEAAAIKRMNGEFVKPVELHKPKWLRYKSKASSASYRHGMTTDKKEKKTNNHLVNRIKKLEKENLQQKQYITKLEVLCDYLDKKNKE